MVPKTYQFETTINPEGKLELAVPLLPGTPVGVLVRTPPPETFDDLINAAASSTDFWDNPLDDEDWNNA